MRWNLSRFDLTAGDKHPFFIADWLQDTGDATFQHRFLVGTKATGATGEVPQLRQSTIYLLMAHALLHAMPEDALGDTYEALLDVYESRRWRAKKALEIEPKQLIRGKLKPVQDRPVFRMVED